MNQQQNSTVFLRPRFTLTFNESSTEVLNRFKNSLKNTDCKYCSKITGNHIIIDVPTTENYFWSPQLNIEIEKVGKTKTIVKGLFGPKPQVWTFFMFIHFAVAVAFIGFSVIAYVKWTLKMDYYFSLVVVIVLPIFWFILYFLGRIGKKAGRKQMEELYRFMLETLQKK